MANRGGQASWRGGDALTLRQFRYFVAVAETESVSRAAFGVGISQSAITAAVQALEEETGTVLFERHAMGMRLTHDGHQLLRYARHILATVADARRALGARPQAVTGAINIGVTRMVSGYYLADLLARFRRVFQNVTVRVVEDERSYLEHLLVGGELDVGLMIVSNLADRQALESELLMRSPWRVWLPARHPLLGASALSLAEIAAEPFIMLTMDELAETTARLWKDAGLKPNVAMRTDSVEAVRSLVGTGLGIATLPDLVYRPWSLEGDRLEARHLGTVMPTVDIGLAWRRGVPLASPVTDFIELCRDYGQGGEHHA
ncbi:LysR family transcriptional regulator [Aurantimonas sp. VKM B-3413]|uniref:LysR family transcriptional regulator n=1 Tax=Aurantimonas sp. VKM B-3413 TaxID=2779401 RepID=UPI001E549A59|nr:LysR family transcriptional regulator [Aurantimonas sp. VKM B-3413]MCB8838963.1 LysR family transcriptional regulator [Aurantimonas sp. VKM B-3413]